MNILGLSIGMMCCILISLYVYDEWTFDSFHSKANRIYRAYVKENWGENQEFFNTVTPFPLGPALEQNVPEVEANVRIVNTSSQVSINDKIYHEEITVGGEDFFHVFDFNFVQGNHQTALNQPNYVVLTQKTATTYFGEASALDKVIALQLGEEIIDFQVKGVVESIPTNSSIQFDILISDANFPKLFNERSLTSGWFNITPETYILLREQASLEETVSKFPALFRSLLGEEDFKESQFTAGLQPLLDIHLNTAYPAGMAPVSNPRYSYILSAIAVLVLIVGCINFITLSIGRSLHRAKEVGIRKAVGAVRRQLMVQFIGEAMLITLGALLIGVAMATFNLPYFNDLAGKQLFFQWNGFMLVVILILVLVIGLFAGSYPAFVLANFKPTAILKGNVKSVGSRQTLRKMLVGFQLLLCIFLIASTLVMKDQLNYLQQKDLGFNREQLVIIPIQVSGVGRLTERLTRGFEQAQQFKNALGKVPGIIAAGTSSHDFGNGGWTSVGYTDTNGNYRTFNMNTIDDQYIPTLKMTMVHGRNFEANNLADLRRGVIINEAFAREYGWTEPIGQKIPGEEFGDHEIIGVVKDFHYASLYSRVEPLAMVADAVIILKGIENINFDNSPMPKMMVRISPGAIPQTLDQLKEIWSQITGEEEFNFSFADQTLARQYQRDHNLGNIVSVATVLSILIGSLGLYGLAALAMQNRVKEICIRKVFGASAQSLLVLLSKEYLFMILISLSMAIPITVYVMQEWLTTFEYRVKMGADVFVLAGCISLLIALLTIGYLTIRTAMTQPAQTLKYE